MTLDARTRDQEGRSPLDQELVEIQTVYGARLVAHADDRSRPEWAREGQELLSLVERGMTVVDAGAGFGYCTVLCARAVGPRGQVVALEPEQGNFALLQRNVRRHGLGNVDTLQLAVRRSPARLLCGSATPIMGGTR